MDRNQKRHIGRMIHKDRDEILQFCSKHKRIHLYGMGYVANMIYEYLKEENIAVYDMIVGNGHRTEKSFKEKYEVLELSETCIDEEDGIILCVREELQSEIKDELRMLGIKDRQIYGQKIYSCNIFPEVIGTSHISSINSSSEGYFVHYLELDKLGKMLGTDKCSEAHNYLNKYEFFLNKWREKELVVLELGVFRGASLKMWGDYFQNGTVYGVDIDPECKKYEQKNCKVIIGDLGNEDTLDKIAELSPTIIIDDASHLWSHQIKAIYHLLPTLKSGGIFIMEDMGTSFSSYRNMNYDDASVSTYDFCCAMAEVVNSGEFLRMNHLSANLCLLKKEIEYLATQIEMISFIHESCIIVKK